MRNLSALVEARNDDPTSILLVEPEGRARSSRACIQLLGGESSREHNVLSVAVSESSDDRLAVWRTHASDVMPRRTAIIDTGRASASDVAVERIGSDPGVTVDVLDSPANPAELALAVGQYLGTWAGTAERTCACIDSASALLEPLGSDEGDRLLDALRARFGAAGVRAHYHVDPSTADRATLDALARHVDLVAEFERGWVLAEPEFDSSPIREAAATAEAPGADSSAETGAVEPPTRVPDSYSLDGLLDLFSPARRRYVLYRLLESPGERASIGALVDEVVDRERAGGAHAARADRTAIELSLVHTHLPRLAAAGIVDVDREAWLVSYAATADLDPWIECLERLEPG